MKKLLSVVTVACILLLVVSAVTPQGMDDDEDDDDFFGGNREHLDPDPDDMLNFKYNHVHGSHSHGDGTRKPRHRGRDRSKDVKIPECNYEAYKENITLLQRKIEDCQQERKTLMKKVSLFDGDKASKEQSKHTPVLMPFVKRYVHILRGHFTMQSHLSTTSEYIIRVSMTEDSREVLQQFSALGVEGVGNVQDVFSTLENIIQSVELMDEEALLYEEAKNSRFGWLKDHVTLSNILLIFAVFSLCRIALCLSLRLHYTWLSLLWRSMLALFFISIPWNWWHLYMTAVARRNRELLREVPSDCTEDTNQGFWSTITSAFTFSKDHCAEYHVKLAVDPMWEITPSRAIAVTFIKSVTEPLELVSRGMSSFIRGALEDLPIHLQPPVFILAVVMILLMPIMFFGYNVRFFHFFRIEEAPRQPGGGMIQQLANIDRDRELEERDAQIQALQAQVQGQEQERLTWEEEKQAMEQERQQALEGRRIAAIEDVHVDRTREQERKIEALQAANSKQEREKGSMKKQMEKMKQEKQQLEESLKKEKLKLSKATAAANAQGPALPPPPPVPESAGVQDLGRQISRPDSASGDSPDANISPARPLQRKTSSPLVATIGPRRRSSEERSLDPKSPDGHETPRMVLASSAPTSSASPVAAVRPRVQNQSSRGTGQDDEDEDEEDLYGSHTDRPDAQEEQQLRVSPMTHATDQHSTPSMSDERQVSGPCSRMDDAQYRPFGEDISPLTSTDTSERSGSERLDSDFSTLSLMSDAGAAASLAPETMRPSLLPQSNPVDASSGILSGSWVGVGSDGRVEEGQGDAELQRVEDSDDGISIIESGEED